MQVLLSTKVSSLNELWLRASSSSNFFHFFGDRSDWTQELPSKSINADVISYGTAMDACSAAAYWEGALHLLRDTCNADR